MLPNGPRPAKKFFSKSKVCRFCEDKSIAIDYKETELLKKYISDRGKIMPMRISGNCAKHQRLVSNEIKKARILAMLPIVAVERN